MKKSLFFILILFSLVGCARGDGMELITETATPGYETNDKLVTPMPKETLTPDVPKENYLDSIVQSVTPYSIFDTNVDLAEGNIVVMGSYSHGDKDYGGILICRYNGWYWRKTMKKHCFWHYIV